MADAEHSKCFSERSAGSSPAFGTKQQRRGLRTSSFLFAEAVPVVPNPLLRSLAAWRFRTIDALWRINKVLGVQVPPSARKERKSSGNTPEDFLLSVPVCFANYSAAFIQKR